MLNVFDVSETLVNHIKSNYPNEIAIIAYYGSYAQGTASKRSDLDFFFIPATPEGYEVSIQFILNDISFDFWPIGWERAEKMASFEDPFTTIIADCQLLYNRSDEDLARFMKLRDSITTMREPSHGQVLLEKAETQLNEAYLHLYKMSRENAAVNINFYRTEANAVLTKVLQSLALLNQTYFTKGWGKNIAQILQYPLKPTCLKQLLEVIMSTRSSEEIRLACEELTDETLALILKKKESYLGTAYYADRLKGCYEETKGTFDKIITACESNDYHTAFFASIGIQDEIARLLFFAETGSWPIKLECNLTYQDLYFQLGFPDLITFVDPHDLTKLQAAVERLSSLFESHLISQGVKINRFQSLVEFKLFLENVGGSLNEN
ncbi:nucleotidyltransferase domain-containing protein [Paenibacillus psychroresistens]|uniref:Nucleotidyltransferase domain-containing protein n=1 Tax=Paenibacillus psychroresistens TaxID=1778678 RepID=A0A6B8RMB6_9BACL|nr:nucleotidyltransferase domain-containing protein [Paenibacillus psychroresistens]QGQ96488.1 nucleotidyltransferase domain-containing protein [Paenibacillus psychroresistens]